jgi:uncharacterized protein (TIGR00299 family) protein
LAILYFDCFSGASGDMILGALVDAGLPLDDVRRALGSLAVDADTLWTERVTRAGVSATKLHVRGEHGSGQEHAHAHAHRTLGEIEHLIDRSALSTTARTRAKALFGRLAAAEASVHDTPLDSVHLHEVGAVDSIIDIVGTVYGLEALGIDEVVASPLNVGKGSIHCAHGVYPVPGPATVRLLEGAPIYAGTQDAELVTPTGALLVTGYAQRFGSLPTMRLRQVGYGAGSRDFANVPNVLRVLIGEAAGTAPFPEVVVIEAEIDDMNPQIFGLLMDRLLAAGALDVFYTSIQMKKNRPGTLLSIVAEPEAREALTSMVFRETTTIGVRFTEMQRECLDRETVTVDTPFGPVRVKVARRHGAMLNASPEFDDCARVAAEAGVPVKDVQAAATKAFLDTR